MVCGVSSIVDTSWFLCNLFFFGQEQLLLTTYLFSCRCISYVLVMVAAVKLASTWPSAVDFATCLSSRF